MYEYKMNPSLNDDFDKPKASELFEGENSSLRDAFNAVTENHYFDTSCQKCGHVPQGERHLCNWEVPTNSEEISNNLAETPKENMEETDVKMIDGISYIHYKRVNQLLLTQRQEIVEIVKKHNVEHITAKFLQECILIDISDLSERIEKDGVV